MVRRNGRLDPGKGRRLHKEGEKIFQIKVSLRGIDPSIHRTIQVHGRTTLLNLHHILQKVMGWENNHLHQFVVGDERYSILEDDLETGHAKNEAHIYIENIASEPGSDFTYEYDFGDSWMHDLVIEKILRREPDMDYPVCVAGERACPPEDCGGIWGYHEILKSLEKMNGTENPDLEFSIPVPPGFDPEQFDIDAVNRDLKNCTAQ